MRSRRPLAPEEVRTASMCWRDIAARRMWIVYTGLIAGAVLLYYLLPRAGMAQAVLITTVNGTSSIFALRAARRTGGSTPLSAALGVRLCPVLHRRAGRS